MRRLLSLAMVLAAALPTYGQALEVAAGSPLTIETLTVRAEVDEGIALVDVDQTFRNGTDAAREGVYTFRLPEKAVVHSFSMWIDGKEKHGHVLEADRARRLYEQSVASKQDPALLEEIGWRTFKVSVFPIPARDTVRIRLVYAHVVDDDLGLRTLEIPMPEGVPVGALDVSVRVSDQLGVAVLDCPTHAQAQVLHDDVMGSVSWSEEGFAPVGPLKVRSAPRVDGVGLAMLAHRLEGAPEGTFLVRVVPRLDDVPALPRDVVFVVDRSGSMKGKKLDQARAALLHGLSTLKEGDRFSIVAFSSSTQVLANEGLVPASSTWLERGREFADKLNASGGTNIDGALDVATAMRVRDDARLFVVSFLTDGQPTVGEKRPVTIVDNYRARSGGDVRLFAFGVGDGVKDFLLTQLAKVSHGAAEYVREDEDLEVKLSAFFDKVESPILTDVEVTVDGVSVQVLSTEPERMPDVFRGTAVVMAGRYTGSGPVKMTLTGRIGPTPVTVALDAVLPEVAGSRAHVAQLWARMRIDRLLDELRVHGMVEEIRLEIVRLGLRYQVVTPYTSFLIVEDDAHVPDDAELARVPEASKSKKRGADAGPSGSTPGNEGGDPSTASGDGGAETGPDSRTPTDPASAAEAGGPTTPGGETGTPTAGASSDPSGPTAGESGEGTASGAPTSGSSGGGNGSYRGPSGEAPPASGREASSGGGGGGAATSSSDVGGTTTGDTSGASAGASGGGASAPTTGGAGRPSGASARRDDSWWQTWWQLHGAALRRADQRVAPALSAGAVDDAVIPALRKVALSPDSSWFLRTESQRALQRLGDDADHVQGLAHRMLLNRRADGERAFHQACQAAAARLPLDASPLGDAERARLLSVLAGPPRPGGFVREYAALTLGLSAHGEAEAGDVVSALLGAAATPGSDAEWLRGVALYALGLLGDARAVAPLVEALESGQIGEHGLGENERVYLVDALGRLGDDADLGVAPQLEKRLRDRGRKRTSVDVARALPTALARLAAGAEPAAQKRIVAALVDAVDSDRDASVVNQATIALGRIAASPDVSPAARGRAKKALLHEWRRRKRDPAPFVALALAIAAKGPDGAELVAPLREALKTADDADSLAATVLALGLVRDNESVDALLGLLRDRGAGPLLRSCAAESIALIGDDRDVTRFGLNQALIGAQDDLAVRITSALVARGDQDALDASLTQIESGHGDQAWLDHLAGTLGRHGGDAEARRLAAVVSDPGQRHSDLTRGMAARALGRMGLSSDARTRIAEDFPYGVYSPVLWAYMGWY